MGQDSLPSRMTQPADAVAHKTAHIDSEKQMQSKNPIGDTKRILYVCFQDIRPQTPAYSHVIGITEGLRANGAEVEFLSMPPKRNEAAGPLSRMFKAVQFTLNVATRVSRGGRGQVVMFRAHPFALPTALWAWIVGAPTVQEVNGQTKDIFITHERYRWLVGLITWVQHVQYRLADHVVAVTPGLVDWLGNILPTGRRAAHVGNGVDTDRLMPLPPEKSSEVTRDAVVYVSSFSRWHGIETVLTACRSDHWPKGYKLVLIGDGPERRRLAEPIRQMVLEGRVEDLGAILYERLPEYLSGALCSLCIIESPEDRSATGVAPLKLFEAMACGLPVIATDQAFLRDLVREADCGVVVPVGSSEAIAEAVKAFVADRTKALRMGRMGRIHSVRDHDWRTKAKELLEVLSPKP